MADVARGANFLIQRFQPQSRASQATKINPHKYQNNATPVVAAHFNRALSSSKPLPRSLVTSVDEASDPSKG